MQPCKIRKTRRPTSGRRVDSGAPEQGHSLVGPREGPVALCGCRRGSSFPSGQNMPCWSCLSAILWHMPSGNLSKFPLSCRQQAGHPRLRDHRPEPASAPTSSSGPGLGGWGAVPGEQGALWVLQVLKALWGLGVPPQPECLSWGV